MLTVKDHKKMLGKFGLAFVGFTYFATMSSLDINFFFKGYVAIIPIQFLALMYIGYLRWINPSVSDKNKL